MDKTDDQTGRAAALEQRIAELEKALAPLAYARIQDRAQDTDTLIASNITVADARQARAVLRGIK